MHTQNNMDWQETPRVYIRAALVALEHAWQAAHVRCDECMRKPKAFCPLVGAYLRYSWRSVRAQRLAPAEYLTASALAVVVEHLATVAAQAGISIPHVGAARAFVLPWLLYAALSDDAHMACACDIAWWFETGPYHTWADARAALAAVTARGDVDEAITTHLCAAHASGGSTWRVLGARGFVHTADTLLVVDRRLKVSECMPKLLGILACTPRSLLATYTTAKLVAYRVLGEFACSTDEAGVDGDLAGLQSAVATCVDDYGVTLAGVGAWRDHDGERFVWITSAHVTVLLAVGFLRPAELPLLQAVAPMLLGMYHNDEDIVAKCSAVGGPWPAAVRAAGWTRRLPALVRFRRIHRGR